jgi:hypothetical protein
LDRELRKTGLADRPADREDSLKKILGDQFHKDVCSHPAVNARQTGSVDVPHPSKIKTRKNIKKIKKK